MGLLSYFPDAKLQHSRQIKLKTVCLAFPPSLPNLKISL